MVEPANVALFTVALENVGPARAVLTLAERLDRNRFRPHIVTSVPVSRALALDLQRLDIPSADLGATGAFDIRAMWRLAARLRRWRIHLIHARLQRAGFYARLAAPAAGRPVVLVNVVNMYGHHFASQHGEHLARPLLWAERRTSSLVDVWVANSAAAARDLESVIGVPAAEVPVIANAIDTGSFARSTAVRENTRRALGVEAGDLVVGTVARLVPLKRLDLLLDAAGRASRELPRLRVLIVGDGPARRDLETRARAAAVNAIFTGHRADVPDLLAAMDVFAFASASEGQPNAVLEAMAAGLPVVAVDIPGLAEVVVQGQTGELTPDSAEALARGLSRVLRDPARAVQMGQAGRTRAGTVFSPTRMVGQFEHIYERALAARAA